MKDCRPIRSVWPSRDASCYVHFIAAQDPWYAPKMPLQRKRGGDDRPCWCSSVRVTWASAPRWSCPLRTGARLSVCIRSATYIPLLCVRAARRSRESLPSSRPQWKSWVYIRTHITRMHACGLWFLLPVSLALRFLEPRALAFGFPPFRKIIYGCGNACNEP